jgi:serine/threonine protein kinase/WD40 repeat protein
MSDAENQRNPVEELAESFLERYRRGERPSITEYVDKHPELADKIRDLFPALLVMEEIGPDEDEGSAGQTGLQQPAPEQIADYRIIREIGRGGMGIVYEAEQESLGRHVALKVLPHRAAADATCLLRFRREARAAARLHHTNIVPVHEVGEAQGVHYYAMQYIQGQSLDEILHELRRLRPINLPSPPEGRGQGEGEIALAGKHSIRKSPNGDLTSQLASGLASGHFSAAAVKGEKGVGKLLCEAPSGPSHADSIAPASPARTNSSELSDPSQTHYYRSVARVGLQVAEALGYAHAQKVLHRDIKPSNLLLDLQGTVWVTDFGLAKEEGDDLTQTGDLVGTLRYMAPERFDGQCDARSDIYSLGLTLYELLTLQPAFDESDRGRLVKEISGNEPPGVGKIARHVPRDLETIVLKAIAKEPARRYQAAELLAEDLRRYLSDRPILARRTSTREHLWRWCRRNPVVAGLLLAVGILVSVVIVVLAIGNQRLNAELSKTANAEAAERTANKDAVKQLWHSLRAEAQARRHSRRTGEVFLALGAIEKAVKIARETEMPEDRFLELRNEAIACLALPDLRVAEEWEGYPELSAHVDFDETQERYVRTERGETVSVYRTADKNLEFRFQAGIQYAMPELSRDGQFLALGTLNDPRVERCYVQLWKLCHPEPKKLLDLKGTAWSFSPDRRMFAVGQKDGTAIVYDLPTGLERHRVGGGLRVKRLSFHPDNRQIAVSNDNGVDIRDVATGKTLATWTLPGAGHLAWHPGGNILAAAEDRVVHLWSTDTRDEVSRLKGFTNGGIAVAFSHSGELIATTGWEGRLRLWDARTGQQLFQTGFGSPSVPRFHRNDRLVAGDSVGSKLRIWEVIPSRVRRKYVKETQSARAFFGQPRLNGGGRLVAVALDTGFGIWDLHTRKQLAAVSCGEVDDLLFERDGGVLIQGPSGVFHWPIRPKASPAGALAIGPPKRLPIPAVEWTQLASSKDGSVLASAQRWGALVWHRDRPQAPLKLAPHQDARYVTVSPDGRWVATGSHNYTGAKIWDAQTGELEKEVLSREGWVHVAFSPDGKWLAASAQDTRLWKVGSWEEGAVVSGTTGSAFAFAPDSKWLAHQTGSGDVRLVVIKSGKELARLEDPDQRLMDSIAFSPDGGRLVATCREDTSGFYVWDLRMIREELRRLDLDSDMLPDFPPAIPPAEVAPLSLEVIAPSRAEQSRFDVAGCREMYRRRSNSTEAWNALAWAHVMAPPEVRDPKEMLSVAQKAVQMEPHSPLLGAAYCRVGRFKEAVAILEKNTQRSSDSDLAFTLYFLAMSWHGLKDTIKARLYYDWAERSTHMEPDIGPAERVRLQQLRAEAADLLGIKEPASRSTPR